MANERSEKSCFQSKFGGGWINSGQFLAELMCERFALSQNDRLAHKFWNDSYWLKKFKLQLKGANELLKEYPVEVILSALKHPDLKRVYSFGLKSVIVPILKRELDKTKRKLAGNINIEIEPEESSIEETTKPRASFSYKTNVLRNIRELE